MNFVKNLAAGFQQYLLLPWNSTVNMLAPFTPGNGRSLREMTNIWKYSGFMGGKCKVLLDLNAHVYFGFFCGNRFIWK